MSPDPRPHWLRLRPRFAIFVLAGVGLVVLVTSLLTYQDNSRALLEARKEHLLSLARAEAWKMADYLRGVSAPAQNLAAVLDGLPRQSETVLYDLLSHQLERASNVYGMAAAYAPGSYDPARKLFSPYVFRTAQGLERVQLDAAGYNYPRQDWFLIPALLGRPFWTEPYFDEGGGNALMTTFAAPFKRADQGEGVVTADMNLEALGRQTRGLEVGLGGYPFLITRQGTFLAAPKPEWVMRETIFSLAEEMDRPDLRALGRRMARGGEGVLRLIDPALGEAAWLAFAPVAGPGWSLGMVVPESEVLAPVREAAGEQAVVAATGLVALVVVVWLMVVGLTRPLNRVVAAARRLSEGDLSTQVNDVRPGDEVGELAQTFNRMVSELNRYVGELTATTKAKERIESELDLARQIQQSILPRSYPAFPDRPQFDLFALTMPAREVGGDFYDFFFVDNDHLGLVVGDVSGKGVPAALFMTVARTLIKNSGQHHREPLTAMNEVNAQILPDNEMMMFVTVFYATYELSTGLLRWVSAGHPSPLLRRAGGKLESLPRLAGMAVGVDDDLGLELGQVALEPEDVLLVYTDGLDEAVNAAQEPFGLERAEAWLAEAASGPAPEMLEGLVEHWRQFAGAVDQFDDLTLLLFRRKL